MAQSAQVFDDLRELLIQGRSATQEEICEKLSSKGHDITQSKVSRLLRKIGAVKSKNELGTIVYRLAKEPAPPTITSQLATLVLEITRNETVIVVTTSPGSASVVSRLLDYHREKLNILGTSAGDDTILIIPRSIKEIQKTLDNIKLLLRSSS